MRAVDIIMAISVFAGVAWGVYLVIFCHPTPDEQDEDKPDMD